MPNVTFPDKGDRGEITAQPEGHICINWCFPVVQSFGCLAGSSKVENKPSN